MLHTQYVFVYRDICILVINFAPPKVKSWLRHCPTMIPDGCLHKQTGNLQTKQVADRGEEADGSSMA